MFRTEIQFNDFLGNEKKATLYFNLSEQEVIELVQKDPMFSSDYMSYVVAEQDIMKMFDIVRKIVALSYGTPSEDGNYFRKSPEITNDFLQSAMYDVLMDKLINVDDVNYLQSFIVGVFPAKFSAELRKTMNAQPAISVVANT